MPHRPNLNYLYDGSFEGLLCCVFESYQRDEIPADILPPDSSQLSFLPGREIGTDPERARRVLRSIPEKMGQDALGLVKYAFLTCLAQKELHILLFLRRGYQCGPSICRRLTDDAVYPVQKAVQHLTREAHLLKGFIRFSAYGNLLAAEIGPKNFVLPLLTEHFCRRFPEERFLIHDTVHEMALLYYPHKAAILGTEGLTMPLPDREEQDFRELWRTYYNTIEVPGRHNPKCRMSHMPKRYWTYMTELGREEKETGRLSAPTSAAFSLEEKR